MVPTIQRQRSHGFILVVSVDGDSLSVLTDTLRYNHRIQTNNGNAPAIIKNKNARLYSNKGDYNLRPKVAFYGRSPI
ncbi:MAG: hypothetical protein IPL23_02605 [Saprospiraceae bacterium]|nr:hypothetical protein [Saprospiraceae bacterium]